MSLPITYNRAARREYDEAADWYEQQQAGLGERFTEAVQAELDIISVMPRCHGVEIKGVRKAKVQGFPYCIYYREEANRVRIISVFHTSRDPQIWQNRV